MFKTKYRNMCGRKIWDNKSAYYGKPLRSSKDKWYKEHPKITKLICFLNQIPFTSERKILWFNLHLMFYKTLKKVLQQK